jgi:hypothetical protein
VRTRLNNPRAVRPDQLHTRLLQNIFDFDHIVLRNVFSDAHDQTNTGIRCFNHCVSSSRRRDENQRCIRARFRDAFRDGSVNWEAGDRLTSFLCVDSADHFGSILAHESAVELTLLSKALDKNFRVFVNEEKRLVEGCASRESGGEHGKVEVK